MHKEPYNPPEQEEKRICFGVEPALKDRLNRRLPNWGDTKKVYNAITIYLVELLETYDPNIVIAGIVSEKIKLSQHIDFNKNATRKSQA